jgi:alginate O-acetyltransferase complex protein AlgI
MLFNSLQYLVFLPLVVIIYFTLPHRWRWMWLLAASYYFYMSWKPIYGLLLFVSSMVDYIVALRLGRTESPSSRWLLLSISLVTNLGTLFFFKYYDFIAESTNNIFAWANLSPRLPLLDLVLPIGISFYTLQILGYTIDVFRRRLAPESHLGIFMLYVTFFPQLVAGPIERAGNLLPQFYKEHFFDSKRASDGLKLITWGLFKKVVIADNLSFYVDPVFAAPGDYTGWAVLIAAYFFTFQIYCDFSGYSDIAIGSARILGFDLMENFRRPFLSRSVRELWQRWHISLTTWFRDYIYFPLGGSRVSPRRADANILTIFLISGLWHGAQWTYVLWGALNGLFYILTSRVRLPRFISKPVQFQPLGSLVGYFLTFNLFALTLIFFRSSSITSAFLLISQLTHIGESSIKFTGLNGGWQQIDFGNLAVPVMMFVALIALMGVEILQEWGVSLGRLVGSQPVWMRWGFYYLFVMAIIAFGSYSKQNMFIYFQF